MPPVQYRRQHAVELAPVRRRRRYRRRRPDRRNRVLSHGDLLGAYRRHERRRSQPRRSARPAHRGDGARRDRLPDRRRPLRAGARRRRRRRTMRTSCPIRVPGLAGRCARRSGGPAAHPRSACARGLATPNRRPTPAIRHYTSGTTGAPRAYQTSRRCVAADIDADDGLAVERRRHPGARSAAVPYCTVLASRATGSLRIGNRFVHRKTHRRPMRRAAGTLYFRVPTVVAAVAD